MLTIAALNLSCQLTQFTRSFAKIGNHLETGRLEVNVLLFTSRFNLIARSELFSPKLFDSETVPGMFQQPMSNSFDATFPLIFQMLNTIGPGRP